MAGTFTWTLDITNGVMLNHTLSKKLRYASIAKTVFPQFVRPEPGFGRRKGASITIQRIRNIAEPTSAQLQSGIRIPIDTFAISTTSITPVELGRGIEYESLADELNNFDLKNPIQRKLRQQMSLVLDTKAAAGFKAASLKYVPTSLTAGSLETTLSSTGTNEIQVAHCAAIRDALYGTYFAEPFDDGKYVGIGVFQALRGIKDDPTFMEWRKYLSPGDVLYRSEVGSIEQIRWLETNHTNALSITKGSNNIGEGVVFGPDAVAMAEVITPHLRAAIPGDFGRIKAVAWYGVVEFGIVWDTSNAGEANVVHITSA